MFLSVAIFQRRRFKRLDHYKQKTFIFGGIHFWINYFWTTYSVRFFQLYPHHVQLKRKLREWHTMRDRVSIGRKLLQMSAMYGKCMENNTVWNVLEEGKSSIPLMAANYPYYTRRYGSGISTPFPELIERLCLILYNEHTAMEHNEQTTSQNTMKHDE